MWRIWPGEDGNLPLAGEDDGRRTARAICVSDGEAQAIIAADIVAQNKLVTIVNGVKIPDALAKRDDIQPLRILAVSRYDHQKNPDLMMEIAFALTNLRPFHLTVLGTGERLDEMRARVKAEGLEDKIDLHGGVPDARPFMRQAKVFLSTSRWEGMPLAVLEAMSEGLCVVATDVVGNRDLIVNGQTGFLFDDAAGALGHLSSLGPEQIVTIGTAGRRFVEQGYSVQAMAQATYAVLWDVASGRAG
ncbi:MAG: glycosyltransferase [Marinovum sp.]|nr:glycosyltransferase [Marinovum sp.]